MFKQHLPPLPRRPLNSLNLHVAASRLATLAEIQIQPQTKTRNTESYTPWLEWVAFLHRLSEQGYIPPLGDGSFGAASANSKSSNKIRTACLNFARDNFDFIRNLSIKDLKTLVTPGCPTLDRKVVNSAKRLRAHFGIDETSVCESCSLRGHCERAYVKPLKDHSAQTADVIRVLFTYGLDHIIGSLENKPCFNKEVEESARRLMKQMTELSLQKADPDSSNSSSEQHSSVCEHLTKQRTDQRSIPIKQGDWICPKCSFINFARNIKCLSCNGLFEERLKNLGEHQDHLPLKKGDWLCNKCHYLNFAKNSRCIRCKEMPPKRTLNSGEWECDSCNFINFRKNMICLKCDHRRNKTSVAADNSTQLLSRDGHYSAVSETLYTHEKIQHDHSIKQSKLSDAHRWKVSEDERTASDKLHAQSENRLVSGSPIIRGRGTLSRDIHDHERRRKDGTKSNRAKSVPYINRSIKVDGNATDCSDSADDDNMSSWFGLRKKV